MRKLLIGLVAVAFVVAFTVPAIAAEWGFYGSARMSTFMDSDSKEVTGTVYDDDDLTWGLQGNSRIGATVKAGDIGGGFEYGSGPNLRKLYGTWTFGAGTLLVGQTYTPVNNFYSNQVYGGDADLLPYGGIYDGRRPMLQLSMGGFKVALVEPNTKNIDPVTTTTTWPLGVETVTTTGTFADTDTTLPKLEASYGFNLGPVKLTLMGLYNTYDVVDATDREESISSYFFGLAFKIPVGAAYINGNLWGGQNLGTTGMWLTGDADPTWDSTNNKIVDNDSLGYYLVAGFKASDMLTFEAGYGYLEHELDVSGSNADDTSTYYVNATINLAKGCFVVPEIGKIDYKESAAKVDQGDTTYFGAKWQINF